MNRIFLSALVMSMVLPVSALAAVSKGTDNNDLMFSTAKIDPAESPGEASLYSDLKNAVREVCGATDIRNAGFAAPGHEQSPMR